MKIKKNTFFILMALMLIFALVSCSQKTESTAGDNNQKTEPPQAVTEESVKTTEPTVLPESPEANETAGPIESSETEQVSEPGNPPESVPSEATGDDNPAEAREFTLEELKQYDGQDGRPAYVAVDGIVYDLTDSKAWSNGKHNGFTAGKDLTDEIKNISPHGVKNLEGIPVVGKLADE